MVSGSFVLVIVSAEKGGEGSGEGPRGPHWLFWRQVAGMPKGFSVARKTTVQREYPS